LLDDVVIPGFPTFEVPIWTSDPQDDWRSNIAVSADMSGVVTTVDGSTNFDGFTDDGGIIIGIWVISGTTRTLVSQGRITGRGTINGTANLVASASALAGDSWQVTLWSRQGTTAASGPAKFSIALFGKEPVPQTPVISYMTNKFPGGGPPFSIVSLVRRMQLWSIVATVDPAAAATRFAQFFNGSPAGGGTSIPFLSLSVPVGGTAQWSATAGYPIDAKIPGNLIQPPTNTLQYPGGGLQGGTFTMRLSSTGAVFTSAGDAWICTVGYQ
jgi:hypothetical protein